MSKNNNELWNPRLAVMMPVTSRGGGRLLPSLELPPNARVYFGINADDKEYSLLPPCIPGVDSVVLTFPADVQLLEIVRRLAKRAYHDDFDLFVLLGDDVQLSPTWYDHVVGSFRGIAMQLLDCVPLGFGCVALYDETSPHFPTFPVVGRPHMDIFEGEWCPSLFINQDADPFLWALYRRFGASAFSYDAKIQNKVGGTDGKPRYTPKHVDWRFDVLEKSVRLVSEKFTNLQQIVTMDVIVPSFRVNDKQLNAVFALDLDPNILSVRFIVIVDDPKHKSARGLYENRLDREIRVRVNDSNLGASMSRTRGLNEADAEWILFLDDDVYPQSNLLLEYYKAIKQEGHKAAGFVGRTVMPNNNETVLTRAIRTVHLLHFWDAYVCQTETTGWGVTAQLVTRRTREVFDPRFPKTGGGEDIDYCLRVAKTVGLPLYTWPTAVATHPWWQNGWPHPKRFYGWASGDCLLQGMYPNHVFWSSLNAIEFCVTAVPLSLVLGMQWWFLTVFCVLLADALLDAYKEGSPYAILGSLIYKNAATELGHFITPLMSNGSLWHVGRRFDWWCGGSPQSVSETKQREMYRCICFVCLALGMHYMF